MKKLVLIIFVLLMFVGCLKVERKIDSYFSILRIEGCQYILYRGYETLGLIHKGDCDNPIHTFDYGKEINQ
jgi:hypothetical protein